MKLNFIWTIVVLFLSTATASDKIVRCEWWNATETLIDSFAPKPDTPSLCERLVLIRPQISALPKNIFLIYPELRVIKVSNGTVQVIRSNTFQNAINVRRADFSYNLIKSVENDAFNGAINLLHLDLSNNQIDSIGSSAFSGLSNLRYLGLNRNFITSLNAAPFTDLVGLVVFQANVNRIQTIAINTFEALPSLKVIDLAQNQLQNLELRLNNIDICKFSVPFNQLTSLRISARNQESTVLHPCGFTVLAFNNHLRRLSIDPAFRLDDLVLNHNNLSDFTGISPHSGLETLRADDNQLTLHVGAINNLVKLEKLSLRQNHIHHIANGTFTGLGKLEELDLSQNPIKILDFANFSGLDHVNTINLDDTDVVRLKLQGINITLPTLNTIKVTKTHWNCSFLQTALKTFNSLGIRIRKVSDLSVETEDIDIIGGIQCVPDELERYSDDAVNKQLVDGILVANDDYDVDDYDYDYEEKDYFINLARLYAEDDGSSNRRAFIIGFVTILTVACVAGYFVMQNSSTRRLLRLPNRDPSVVDSSSRLLGP